MTLNHMDKRIQTPASGSARRWAVFILLILLVAVAVMLWKWAEKQGHVSVMERSLATYLADADVFSNRSRRILAELELEKAEMEQRLSHLEERLQAANRLSVVEVGELSGDNSKHAEIRVLGAIERLIVTADRYLQLTGDVHSALDSLKYAQELLQSAVVPDALKLNESLTGNIEQLKVLATLDVQEINRSIKALAAQIDNLPLIMDGSLTEVDLLEKQDTHEPRLWFRYLLEIEKDFDQLVKIEKINDPKVSLLSPSQILFLKENIRLQLMQARLALLIRDEGNFSAAVETAKNWIQKYFDTAAQPVEEALGKLENLINVNTGAQLPDLGETLEIVHHSQLMLKGEGE